MLKHLVSRSKEIIEEKGMQAYFARVKNYFDRYPLLDESWFMLNFLINPSRQSCVEVQGSQMMLDLSDHGIHRDLFLHGIREPLCTAIFQKELTEGMHIADIGANIGYYVLMEMRAIGPHGKIYAIEPAPKNFQMLRDNVARNSCEGMVELHNKAASDKKGKVSFFLGGASNHHRFSYKNEDSTNCIEVEAISIDELLAGKRIDVVRMDPEGAEWLILNGMKETLAS